MKAIRWLGPQSCGEWLQPKPKPGKRLGEGPGHRCFSARGPRAEGRWVVNSALPSPPGLAELRAPLVPPTAFASQGPARWLGQPLPFGASGWGPPAPRTGSHHLLVPSPCAQ